VFTTAYLPPTIRNKHTAVQDLEGVERGEGLERLHEVDPDHALIHALAPVLVTADLALQVLEAAVLHHYAQVQRLAVQKRLVQAHDARVLERRKQPDLWVEDRSSQSLADR
jgi:hypothetical protein